MIDELKKIGMNNGDVADEDGGAQKKGILSKRHHSSTCVRDLNGDYTSGCLLPLSKLSPSKSMRFGKPREW